VPLLQGVPPQLPPRLPRPLSPQRRSRSGGELAKLLTNRITAATSWAELLHLVQCYGQQCDCIHLSALYAAAARVDGGGSSSRSDDVNFSTADSQAEDCRDVLLEELAALAVRNVRDFKPATLVVVSVGRFACQGRRAVCGRAGSS